MKKRQLKLTDEDKIWAKCIKNRDEWKCVICGDTQRPNAHHLIVRENKESKLSMLNGLTLCPKHHFFCRKISAHNNPLGLYFWLEKNRPEQLQYCREEIERLVRS
jgi:recombinational DNA repair protein RecR